MNVCGLSLVDLLKRRRDGTEGGRDFGGGVWRNICGGIGGDGRMVGVAGAGGVDAVGGFRATALVGGGVAGL